MQLPFLFDWKKSKAHYELLSKFIKCESFDKLTQDDYWASAWKEVLKESPQKAIERFIKDGYLETAKLPEALDYLYKATELKAFCSERGLKVSGRKAELIERLIAADKENMTQKIGKARLYCCSDVGRVIAEEYITKKRTDKENAQSITIDALKKKDFLRAAKSMIDYEAQQVFQRGMGINWKNVDASEYTRGLTTLFTSSPRILSDVSIENLEHIRQAAGFNYLWGQRNLDLISGFSDFSTRFDNDSCVDMMTSYVLNQATLTDYKNESDIISGVEILTCNDDFVCPECKKIASKKYKISGVIPELPYPGCTSEHGCRCTYTAIVKGLG